MGASTRPGHPHELRGSKVHAEARRAGEVEANVSLPWAAASWSSSFSLLRTSPRFIINDELKLELQQAPLSRNSPFARAQPGQRAQLPQRPLHRVEILMAPETGKVEADGRGGEAVASGGRSQQPGQTAPHHVPRRRSGWIRGLLAEGQELVVGFSSRITCQSIRAHRGRCAYCGCVCVQTQNGHNSINQSAGAGGELELVHFSFAITSSAAFTTASSRLARALSEIRFSDALAASPPITAS